MKYSPIFTIEIVHDFFSETKPQMLRIVPSQKTESKLRDAGMLAKFIQNKLYVFAKHLDTTTPLLKIPNDFKLQFFLEVTDFEFNKITNYKETDPYNRKLYFSNTESIIDQNDKSVESVLYLHEKLPQFDVTNAYKYNDLIRDGANTAYECLAKIDANNGDLTDDSQFRTLEKVSYVTSQNALLFTGPEKAIKLDSPSATVNISYFEYNPVSELYDIEKKATTIGTDQNPGGENLDSVLLNFYSEDGQEFPEGIYRVTINAQEEFVYFRSENDWQPYIGLIDIHHNDLVPANYKYLQTDGSFFIVAPDNTEVETRNYIIRFAPAQYLLKYVCRTSNVLNITDDDGVITFTNIGDNTFQSTLPVRMNEKAMDTISVEYDGSDVLKKTKNPGHRDLSILDDENKYLVSETFLNL